jgi:hypothetical protein
MLYEVWYMRPEWFREGSMGEKPNAAELEKTHIQLKTIWFEDEIQDKELNNLELIFVKMQAERWSPNGEARGLIQRKGLRHTSMSVGDVIKCGDAVYLCSSVGFMNI